MEADFFGHNARGNSGKHRSSFIRGQLLAKDPSLSRVLFVQGPMTFTPSTKVFEFVEDLIKQGKIPNTTSRKRRRLQKLNTVHKDILKVSDPSTGDGDSTVSSSHYHWHCTSFYKLNELNPNDSDLFEEWRRSWTLEDKRCSYRFYSCTCPRYVRVAFCKHSFALGLIYDNLLFLYAGP